MFRSKEFASLDSQRLFYPEIIALNDNTIDYYEQAKRLLLAGQNLACTSSCQNSALPLPHQYGPPSSQLLLSFSNTKPNGNSKPRMLNQIRGNSDAAMLNQMEIHIRKKARARNQIHTQINIVKESSSNTKPNGNSEKEKEAPAISKQCKLKSNNSEVALPNTSVVFPRYFRVEMCLCAQMQHHPLACNFSNDVIQMKLRR